MILHWDIFLKLVNYLIKDEKNINYSILYLYPQLFDDFSILSKITKKISISQMVVNGYLDLLIVKRQTFPFFIAGFSFAKAAQHNHLDVLKWAYENENMELVHPNYQTNTMAIDWAAENGNLEVVKWLHERHFPCTSNAIDWAAKNGHTKVVRFLLSYGHTFTIDALRYATWGEYTKIVQMLQISISKKYITNQIKNDN